MTISKLFTSTLVQNWSDLSCSSSLSRFAMCLYYSRSPSPTSSRLKRPRICMRIHRVLRQTWSWNAEMNHVNPTRLRIYRIHRSTWSWTVELDLANPKRVRIQGVLCTSWAVERNHSNPTRLIFRRTDLLDKKTFEIPQSSPVQNFAEIQREEKARLEARLHEIRAKYGDRLRSEMETQTQFYRKWFWYFCNVSPADLECYRIPLGHNGQGQITFNPMDNSSEKFKVSHFSKISSLPQYSNKTVVKSCMFQTHYSISSEKSTFWFRKNVSRHRPDTVTVQLWRDLVAERRGEEPFSSSSTSDLAPVKSSSPGMTPRPTSSDCGEDDASLLFNGSHSSSPVPDWLVDMSHSWKSWSGAGVGSTTMDESEVDLDILIVTLDENDVLPMPSPFSPVGARYKVSHKRWLLETV